MPNLLKTVKRKWPAFVLIILLLFASLLAATARADSEQLKQKIQSFLGTLKLIEAEYKEAVSDGKIIDDKEYLETEIFLDKARAIYSEIREEAAAKSQDGQKDIADRLKAIEKTVSEKGGPAIVSEKIRELAAVWQGLFGADAVSDNARGEVNQQSLAEAELAGEQLVGELRVGLIIESAEDFWLWEGEKLTQAPAAGQTHHLEIVLREKATKKMIPNADIKVKVERDDGWSETKKLYPLWGEFFHYGNNFNLTKDGDYKAKFNIQHGWRLAHEDLVEWVKPIDTVFEFKIENGAAKLKPQPAITETQAGFSPGDDIDIAVAELSEEKIVGKYKIGFIAEKAEEIYSLKSGKLVGTMKGTDIFHLEAVVREASSGKMVPYADVIMRLTNKETGENQVYNLFPMWSEFFHYGSNADMAPGIWEVAVQVKPPDLAYHQTSQTFTEAAAAKFTFDTSRVFDEAEETETAGGVERIKNKINEAVKEYQTGANEKASGLARDAFIIFEEEIGSELGSKNASLEDKIESEILALAGLMKSGAPRDQVEARTELIAGLLDKAKITLEGKSNPFSLFIQSLVIIVREGFEAIIIIAAIIAYLAVSQNRDKIKVIYYAAGLAILASFLTAWLMAQVFKIEAANQEILEGITMLVATAVLFYVSYWLISKVQAEKWRKFIEGKVKEALTAENQFILGLVAFLAVYREGFETVLFYKALSLSAPGGTLNIITGFSAGVLVLAAVYWLFSRYSLKIPVKQFFIVTSAILYYMAFTFMGNGLAELQEGGAVSVTPLLWLPKIHFLGLYPTVETFAFQMVLLAAFALSLWRVFIWRPRKADGK